MPTREFIRALARGYKIGSHSVTVSVSISTSVSAGTPNTQVRNVFQQPFSTSSIWNVSLGSGAVYRDAQMNGQPDNANQFGFVPGVDGDIVIIQPTSPRLAVFSCNVGWSGGNRCVPTDVTRTAVPCPTTVVIPTSNSNNCSGFVLSDSRTLAQMQPFTRCVTANATATCYAFFNNQDLYGAGIGGSHGGSGLSCFGGCIRVGELRPGDTVGPRHVIHINVFARQFLYKNSNWNLLKRWPADRADAYAASANGYGSWNGGSVSNTDMVQGSLLALLPSFNITAVLSTTPGRLIAWTFREYGAYICDDVGVAGFAFGLETGPGGTKAAQFLADWGYAFAMHETDNHPWRRDISTICDNLYVISNSSPGAVGGGGIRRQSAAPQVTPP